MINTISSQSEVSGVGLFVAITIGILMLCVLVLGVSAVLIAIGVRSLIRVNDGRRRRRARQHGIMLSNAHGESAAQDMNVPLLDEDFSPETASAIEKAAPQLQRVAISMDDVEMGEQIGVGSSSRVFRARYMGREVAVKQCLIVDLLDDPLQDFMKETNLMSQLRHPNIVQFIGATIRAPYFFIIGEFCENGSVDKMLTVNSTLGEGTFNKKNMVKLDLYAKVRILRDTAQGMLFLSTRNPPVVHRDLKLANLLVSSDWVTKIGDFGVSRMIEDRKRMTMVGTVEMSAPEVLQFGEYSVTSDVYSFGIMLHELIFEQSLYDGMTAFEVMQKVVNENMRPTIPEEYDEHYPSEHVDRLVKIMKTCWASDPEKRPSFEYVAQELGSILSELEPEPGTPFYRRNGQPSHASFYTTIAPASGHHRSPGGDKNNSSSSNNSPEGTSPSVDYFVQEEPIQ